MKYEPLRQFADSEVEEILSSGEVDLIKLLPLSIGEYHNDVAFAQNFCEKLLMNGTTDEIRANAVLGLSYIARRFVKLDKSIIPKLKDELKRNNTFHDRVEYSIDDIYLFMRW